MRTLISAPCASPRFEGPQLLAAARAIGWDALLFDHPASRDPTIELPAWSASFRPRLVLLVQPAREEPSTLDLLRRFGARTVVWSAPVVDEPDGVPVRTRWIARAADAVATTVPVAERRLVDRRDRPAACLPGAFDPTYLGATESSRDTNGGGDGDRCVLVRGADDRFAARRAAGRPAVDGWGPRVAFPAFVRVRPLESGKQFARCVGGRSYLTGGRPTAGPPSVFDDALAARACGARVFSVPYLGEVSGMTAAPDDGVIETFADRLRNLSELP